MIFFERWRAERDLARRTKRYVQHLLLEPDEADVAWLCEVATGGDVDHARWELRYARRALGLLVAERDALDDRTGSDVARELGLALEREPNIAEEMRDVAERQFNARLSAYRDALGARAGQATPARMGQTLFAFAGGSFRTVDGRILRGGDLLLRYQGEANAALRDTFGAASLPEHLPPSALVGGPGSGRSSDR